MGVTHVDVKEAYRLQTEEGYAYIDVRSIPEYERGHPAGGVTVPSWRPRSGHLKEIYGSNLRSAVPSSTPN